MLKLPTPPRHSTASWGSSYKAFYRLILTMNPRTRSSKPQTKDYYHGTAIFRCCAVASALSAGLRQTTRPRSQSARPRRASSGSSDHASNATTSSVHRTRFQKPTKVTFDESHILSHVFFRRQSPPLSCWTGAWPMSWQGDPGSFRQLNHHSSQPPQTRLCTRPIRP